MFCVLYSAVGSVLYLFGGSNYPESEECLDGLYAYDIGKTYAPPGAMRNDDDDDDDMKHVPAFQPYGQNIINIYSGCGTLFPCGVTRVSLVIFYSSVDSWFDSTPCCLNHTASCGFEVLLT